MTPCRKLSGARNHGHSTVAVRRAVYNISASQPVVRRGWDARLREPTARAGSTMSIISTDQLTKTFGEITAVDHVSFAVERGEIFAFLGPNGAGKSTTIKMLTTLLTPTSGRIEVAGHDP